MILYVLGEHASRDLDAIWDYIAEDNVEAADEWIARLFDGFEAVGISPGIGHRRSDLTDRRVLFWSVGSYLIIYRTESTPVEIIAVTQGSRDIPAFLEERFSR